ncbi:PTS lactose/cellobiose transporter subunit IIA [Staphylococcus arlettae]|uniref:PTS lactose/cellobiose transporter subunit IIA n=1 Tax=Staphylococcus arlettae TaxID=29378 RepID=UPI000D1C0355|nr:PTS lactose/cellobiose transporter subunit IIA [Staphylococcus arlettae]MBF0738445.1 PTS lactose/cellobiose transporter subunit IIA [Staphylococcus arlettae]MBK3720118.1 Lichenan-specific phosphotransferase enzyme IIA component [Staphylococcus arlettae]PTH24530.1 PTS lactose/cellobiose transporter subunit IIA [Staphylococcus arlettae]PTH30837.1 PTS lactose/cellobiose transporter subunit IIA [Staphylococcus arlettae]PTH53796.1 PTS lactose/cellobiose transporter subunit IIA [Staphylococcus ar
MAEDKSISEAMQLIAFGGDAKSHAMEAIHAAKKGDFQSAHTKIQAAEQSLLSAHNAQTEMLTAEAQGDVQAITLLTVHSQDHLMTAITFNDLAKEIIELYEIIQK